MFVLPLGLEAKTISTPWVTFALVVVISFASIFHRNLTDQLNEIYLHSDERQLYQEELKTYLDERCASKLSPGACAQFHTEVRPEHLISPEVFFAFHPEQAGKVAPTSDVTSFVQPWLDEDYVLKLTESDSQFRKLQGRLLDLNKRLQEFLQGHQILASIHWSWPSVLKSQFIHAGLGHLAGNLIFLLLLAFPVEQRLGSVRYILLYLAAGVVGMSLQTLVGERSIMIVGASANIFGIAGAFLALFWRQQMRLVVSFFLIHQQVILIPVMAYFGMWVLAEEVVGVLRSTSDGVAHWAHLGGFFAGFASAKLFAQFPKYPEGFIYPYEREFDERARKEPDDHIKLGIYNHWLLLNPTSRVAARYALIIGGSIQRRDSTTLKYFREVAWPKLFVKNLDYAEVLEFAPISWLRDETLILDPQDVSKALSVHHISGHLWAEWLLLYHLLNRPNIEVPADWEKRFIAVSILILQDQNRLEFIDREATRDPHLKEFLGRRQIFANLIKEPLSESGA